jgi:hypothetical protein
MELIHAMLKRDAGSRISAEEALQHPWFAKHGVGEQRHILLPAWLHLLSCMAAAAAGAGVVGCPTC